MKLNKVLIAAAASVACLALSAVSVFAVDATENDFYTVGAPISVETGKVVNEVKSGDVIAIPVDINTSTGKIRGYAFSAKYDNTVLSPGQSFSKASGGMAFLDDCQLPTIAPLDGSYKELFVLDGIQDADESLSNYNGVSKDYKADQIKFWATYPEEETLTDAPEFLLLFEAKADIEGLNKELLTVDNADSTIAPDTTADLLNPTSVETKLNACAGAFNIKIDATALTSYVQALYVQIGDAEAVPVSYYTVDGDIYKFPVRVLTTKGDTSVDVKVLADTSSDLDGKNNVKSKVSLGTITVTLDSPSDYVDSTIS